jgi:thiol-disulfide isomerase/thioredoxin
MMIRTASSILLFFVFLTTFAQYKIEGSLQGLNNENIVLLRFFGDRHSFLDSTSTDRNGWFRFSVPENTPTGLYSLALNNKPFANLIFNKENITMKIDWNSATLPEFVFSIENLVYYDYMVRSDIFNQKYAQLVDILGTYPEQDSFYFYTGAHFDKLQAGFREYTDLILEEHAGTYAARMVRSDRPVMIPAKRVREDYLQYMRSHYFDEVDFSDTTLLNSNVFTGKAIDYLKFYSMQGIGKARQEELFIQAVDSILLHAMENGQVFDFLMQYLIEGFDMYGFDNVISHIAGNYEPAGACVDEDSKSELHKRMESLREMAVGKTAPPITFTDENGQPKELGSIDRELVAVIFWASWCPHCVAMMPELMKLYEAPGLPPFEILAISIDTSATEWEKSVQELGLPWINYAELKGWNSRAVKDYSIYATPTMFLLNRKREILARPVNVTELRYALESSGR